MGTTLAIENQTHIRRDIMKRSRRSKLGQLFVVNLSIVHTVTTEAF